MKYILFCFILFCYQHIQAQQILVNGKEKSPQLNWDDFKGKPDHGSPFFAYTYWSVNYAYEAFTIRGDTVKWNVKIILDLTKDSWKKKENLSDSLLNHEQGHFDIGRICASETQRLVNTTVFLRTNNYKEQLQKLVVNTVEKYRKMNAQYDEETDHGKNRTAQLKWDGLFSAELSPKKQ